MNDYVLALSKEAYVLYKKSASALNDSDVIDYLVYPRKNHMQGFYLKGLEHFVSISKNTFDLLHHGLCEKFRERIPSL
ncbi:MAG: hypothetical protein ABJN84_16490 [Flavobacteriaceae bacterium]